MGTAWQGGEGRNESSSSSRGEAPCPIPFPQETISPQMLCLPLTPLLPVVLQADAVLQEFLQSRKTLAKSILNTDRSLTEKDRELKSTFWAGETPLPVGGQA